MGQLRVPLPVPLPVPLSVVLSVVLLWQLGGAQDEGAVLPGECPRPPRLQYAELNPSSGELQNFPPGTKISFTCRPGYIRVPGKSLTWTCGEDLQWSPTGDFCTARKCIYPGNLENGYFDPTDLTFGSRLTFSCNEGYRIRGNEEISCIIKGGSVDWSGLLPYCEKIPCEPPPKIANGIFEERDSYVYQSSVTYRCQTVPQGSDPFSLIGPATIFCTADAHSNGVWSGPPPQCRVVKCENPRVENGRKISGFGDSYTYKNSVMFQCDEGYFLVGADVIICEENNTWVPPKPTCQKITADLCPAPKVSSGFVVPIKASYARGESVQLRCNAGCSFPGGSVEVTVTCEGQGSWGSLQHCACESEGSGSTPVINHGRVTAGQKPSYSVGDVITIECHSGYTLHGESQLQYIGNNQWQPAVPSCQLSAYVIAIICVIVVIVTLLAAFWIYKKFFSQNGCNMTIGKRSAGGDHGCLVPHRASPRWQTRAGTVKPSLWPEPGGKRNSTKPIPTLNTLLESHETALGLLHPTAMIGKPQRAARATKAQENRLSPSITHTKPASQQCPVQLLAVQSPLPSHLGLLLCVCVCSCLSLWLQGPPLWLLLLLLPCSADLALREAPGEPAEARCNPCLKLPTLPTPHKGEGSKEKSPEPQKFPLHRGLQL